MAKVQLFNNACDRIAIFKSKWLATLLNDTKGNYFGIDITFQDHSELKKLMTRLRK